jgi:site-specific recombinase XerD
MTVADLVEHYRQRELAADNTWKSYSTQHGYESYTYSTMLKQVGADIKVMQELLRHSSVRCTQDTYTQAIMPAKQAAQSVCSR